MPPIPRGANSSGDDVTPVKLRRLAIVTGCFVAISGVLLMWTDPIPSCLLVLSAAIQPRSPRPGRWLMWVSALSVTVFAAVVIFADGVAGLSGLTTTIPGAVILVALAAELWCDVALVLEAARRMRNHPAEAPRSRRNLDWVVWTAAVVMTGYYSWASAHNIRMYSSYGRLANLLPWPALTVVMLLFDVALLIHAAKRPRTE